MKGKAESRSLPAGTFIVRTDQPLGKMAAYLLEPESEDGLLAWNFLDPDVKPGMVYPIARVMQSVSGTEAIQEVGKVEPLPLNMRWRQARFGHRFCIHRRRTLEPLGPRVIMNCWLAATVSGWSLIRSPAPSRASDVMKQLIDAYSSLDRVKNARGALERVDPGILVGEKNTALLSAANDLYYFDGATRKARPLTNSPEEEELSELSPNGAYAGFVKKNDLYVIDCQTGEERRLTKDGSPELLNGKLDWVYQEEVYGRDKFRAFWFSPDSQRIAFLQLDESPVPHYEVSDSISYRQTLEDTRYPKAGEPLPIARVWIVDIASGQLREVDLSQHPAEDRLVVRFTWSPTNECVVADSESNPNRTDRAKSGSCHGKTTRMLFEKSRGWIEVLGQPKFLPDGDFLWLSDLPDGRRHVHRFDVESRQLKALTRGDWDVADIVGVTADGKTALCHRYHQQPDRDTFDTCGYEHRSNRSRYRRGRHAQHSHVGRLSVLPRYVEQCQRTAAHDAQVGRWQSAPRDERSGQRSIPHAAHGKLAVDHHKSLRWLGSANGHHAAARLECCSRQAARVAACLRWTASTDGSERLGWQQLLVAPASVQPRLCSGVV